MTISQAASVNLWREAILDRLAALCMDAPQDEPPASILRRIIAAEVEIALDPSVSEAEAIRAHLAAQPAPAEDFCYCDDDISLQMVSGGAALEGLYGRVTLKINGQYVDYVKAQPAPVPLTDTETHAELWKLAVRKGLITVRSELIDPRNHGTRVSWMQGHDKACDISNDAAAHGIAASPAAPAAPVVPLTDERITKALRRAFSLGQTYWQQADSDSYTQNAKSDETRQKFETLIVETLNGITGGSK